MTEDELENYWNTLLSLSGKRENLDEDQKILLNTIKYPSSLFRFRSVSENSLNALQENKMYFSSANYYDDPFDTYLRVDIPKLTSELKSTIENNPVSYEFIHMLIPFYTREQFLRSQKIIKDHDSFLKNAIALREYIQNNSYSICFCEDVQNEVVWLKYAENHRGYVIEYAINDEILKTEWNNYYKANLLPIYYSNNGYEANHYFSYKIAYSAIKNPSENPLLVAMMQKENICWESVKISTIKKKCHEYDKE